MILGFLFALSAALLWSVINVFDKAVMERFVRNPLTIAFALYALNLPVGIVLMRLTTASIEPAALPRIVIAALIGVAANILYFTALKRDQVSRVVPLFALGPLLTAVSGFIFLNERFTLPAYFGIALIVISVWLLQVRGNIWSPLRSPAAGLMLLTTLLWAGEQTLLKPLIDVYGTIAVVSRMFVFDGLVGIIGSFAFLSLMSTTVRRYGKRAVLLLFLFEGLNVLAFLVYFRAVEAWHPSLASAASSVQYLLVFLLARSLSKRFPEIYREERGRRISIQRFASIVGIIAGVALLTLA